MATNDIRQRIGLEGGTEVKKELDDIGESGSKAFQKLQTAAGSTTGVNSLGSALDQLRAKTSGIGQEFESLANSLSPLGARIGDVLKSTGLIGGALAAGIGAATAGFGSLVKNAAQSAEAMDNSAQAAGLSRDQFNELSFAFRQNGVDSVKFTQGMNALSRAIDDQVRQGLQFQKQQQSLNRDLGTGKINFDQYNKALQDLQFQQSQNISAFSRLGAQIAKNADGTVDLAGTVRNVANAFAGMKDGAEKTALAQQLFGRSGADFIKTLNGGASGLASFGAEARRLQPTLSDLAQNQAQKLNTSFENLSSAFQSLKQQTLAPFFEPLTGLINSITEAVVRNRGAIAQFAQDVANKHNPIFVDLINLLSGREDLVKNRWIVDIKNALTVLGRVVTELVIPALKNLFNILNSMGDGLNSLNDNAQKAGKGLNDFAKTVFDSLSRGADDAVRKITDFFAGLGQQIASTFSGLPQQVGSAFSSISQIASQTANGILQFFSGLGGQITSVLGGLPQTIGNVFNSISQFAGQAANNVVQFFTNLPSTLSGAFNGLVNAAQNAWNGIQNGAQSVVDGISNIFGDVAQTVGSKMLSCRCALP